MKKMLFPRLAWTGIVKNKKLYLPYLCSTVGMVMMFCILEALTESPQLQTMKGGTTLSTMLGFGRTVIAVFSLIFLFYTNSFLIRRRYREFGLYSVLGMDKRGIAKVMIWESVLVAAISLGLGIGLGLLFQKLAELALVNLVQGEISYEMSFTATSALFTAVVYGAIFLILLVKSLIQLRKSNPLALMQSDIKGEKPPKANRFLTLAGVILLAIAYYLAVSITSPLAALFLFCVAVIMVIVATYLLFITGSVTLCRVLQRKKSYYYKKSHFVAVSSMLYRMKRNGAGLASICILSTMVLVTFSSSASLFLGKEASLDSAYMNDLSLSLNLYSSENIPEIEFDTYRDMVSDSLKEYGLSYKKTQELTYASANGMPVNDTVELQFDETLETLLKMDDMVGIYFLSAAEYTKLTGNNVSLEENQALLYPYHCKYPYSTLSFGGMKFEITELLDECPEFNYSDDNLVTMNQIYVLVISDFSVIDPLFEADPKKHFSLADLKWYYGFDINADDEAACSLHDNIYQKLIHNSIASNDAGNQVVVGFGTGCKAFEHQDFYLTFGSLFFIGILLCVVFVFAMAMIIYYKQISEGYEDQAGFAIMQKVGMTHEDIKKSINAQIRTVFFAPLLFAGMHLAFAFPMIWKILQLFQFKNLKLIILITIGAFSLFALLYGVLYKVTAHAYFAIVAVPSDD